MSMVTLYWVPSDWISVITTLHLLCYMLLLLINHFSPVSDSVRPHRRQTTRLPRPWDSPGKNTGVGCHFLLQCMKVKSESEVAQSCPTPSDPMDCSLPGSSIHGFSRQEYWSGVPLPSPATPLFISLFSSPVQAPEGKNIVLYLRIVGLSKYLLNE